MDAQIWLMVPLLVATALVVAALARVLARPGTGPGAGAPDDPAGFVPAPAPPAVTLPNR